MMKRCIFISFIIWGIFLGFSIFSKNEVFVFAQEKSNEKREINSQKNNLIEFLEFREVDIKDVLRQLAKQYNLNIVFSENVSGAITVQLHNVTIDEALDSIITINGYVYTKKENVIKVTTPEEAEREGRVTKVFKLANADASKLKDTLTKVLSPDGTIEADTRSNSIIVTDTPAVINKIAGMIPSLDDITPEVLIEAKFIETSLSTTENLGIKWTTTASLSGAKRSTTLPFPPLGNNQWMKNIFTPANPQNIGGGTDTEFPSPFGFPYSTTDNLTFGTLDFTQVQAVMDFLFSSTKSRLVSAPRLVTMDNKEAMINIGKTRPIPTFELDADTGKYNITGFTEKIEGVVLTVTPQVSRDSNNNYYIRLKLNPKVTTLTETVPFAQLGFDYPVMSTREANTEVSIKDGQTIVIGGLIENKKTETKKKIPLLGDIPLVGALFSRKDVDPNSRSELLIFVTARVVKEKGRLVALKSNIATSPQRQLKLNFRKLEGSRK